ncbi:MAG: malto-oligosyltrehalose trehalohydrolase [Elusimicrobiota bacterium]|nr:MAG: malto-oligosyltrehalose trehalohydrolase [Elusimicrobiota bacterium]
MATEARLRRRFPVGAEYAAGAGTHFRVWAPARRRAAVLFESGRAVELEREAGGHFSGLVADAAPGTDYRFLLDGEGPFPDPASRFQPEGPHGASRIVDPAAFAWTDSGWKGVALPGQVFYELHAGTFTREGTWEAAAARLASLADLGVTTIEVMPVADFPGRFGWGYDGVGLFAPTRLYGGPDDFRAFVDRAHAAGLGVILDVVYNHLGPDGNYLSKFSSSYFAREKTEWGDSLNFDGPGSSGVREYFVANAAYWISEYHLDGLRLDATQSIKDDSRSTWSPNSRAPRAAAGARSIVITAENERQDARLARPASEGGFGLDSVWNDDFHHAARVALTGRREAYFSGYLGAPQEFVSAAARGFLFQGQYYEWQKKPRGTPSLDLPPAAFVHYLENHDQVANNLDGRRLHLLAHAGRHRALTALLLLGPQTPLLFQGQEFGSPRPFQYFADHSGELGAAVSRGRREYLTQFPSYASPESAAFVPEPGDPATFERCRLDAGDLDHGRAPLALALHRDLLRLRREDPVIRAQRRPAGAVLGPEAFVLRFPGEGDDGDRLLLVNLGLEGPAPVEPLLAPPAGARWETLWTSEAVEYGGAGFYPVVDAGVRWRLPAASAVLLRSAA